MFIPFILTRSGWEWLNFNDKGQIGDTIGGITAPFIGLLNVLLLYLTFQEQARFNQNQTEVVEDEQFKDSLFGLLQKQREIKQDVKSSFSHPYNSDVREIFKVSNVKGEEFFEYAYKQLSFLFETFESDKYDSIPMDEYQEIADEVESEIEEESYSKGLNGCNVPEELEKEFEIYRYNRRLPLILGYINNQYMISELNHFKYQKLSNNENVKIAFVYYFFYRKHPSVDLYFRHLYCILKFIKSSEDQALKHSVLNKNTIIERFRNYAQFIQAQMSVDELRLTYYNSFLFPKMQALLLYYGIFDNLRIQDLVNSKHCCIPELRLKSRNKELLDIINAIEK